MLTSPQHQAHKKRTNDRETTAYCPLVIIGAGAAGVAMGCQLKRKLNFDRFQIYERRSGIGGVWWSNRYPGIECDVPSAQYSFSFAPNYAHPRIYPSGKEFLDYLNGVVAKLDLEGHIQLNTDVINLRWIEEDIEWEVTLRHLVPGAGDLTTKEREEKITEAGLDSVQIKQETLRARVVISCAGLLVEPNTWPENIAGRDQFTGEVLHSARWRDNVDFNGKDVVIIGSGCTAAQIVPSLLKEPYHVKSLTQIMRSAPWVMPRIEEPFGKEKYARYAPIVFRYFPILGFIFRAALYIFVECLFFTVFQAKNEKWRKSMERMMLDRIHELVPERYQRLMTPDYPYGCKRRVFDTEWLKSMHKPNYHLTDRRVLAVEGKELILGPHQILKNGDDDPMDIEIERIRADIIVLANGFDTTHYLHPIVVRGRNGILLHELWGKRGGPSAYMGTAVHGFPNFFMIFGPNTGSGHNSLIFAIENMVNYVIKIAEPLLAERATVAEIKAEPEAKWTQKVHRDLKKTVYGECRNWYMDEKGYNSVIYPRSQTEFALRYMFPRYQHWNVTYAAGCSQMSILRKKSVLYYISAIVVVLGYLVLKNDVRC